MRAVFFACLANSVDLMMPKSKSFPNKSQSIPSPEQDGAMRRQEVKSSTIRDVEKQAAASDEKRQASVSSNSNNKLALVNSYSKGSGEGAVK